MEEVKDATNKKITLRDIPVFSEPGPELSEALKAMKVIAPEDYYPYEEKISDPENESKYGCCLIPLLCGVGVIILSVILALVFSYSWLKLLIIAVPATILFYGINSLSLENPKDNSSKRVYNFLGFELSDDFRLFTAASHDYESNIIVLSENDVKRLTEFLANKKNSITWNGINSYTIEFKGKASGGNVGDLQTTKEKDAVFDNAIGQDRYFTVFEKHFDETNTCGSMITVLCDTELGYIMCTYVGF